MSRGCASLLALAACAVLAALVLHYQAAAPLVYKARSGAQNASSVLPPPRASVKWPCTDGQRPVPLASRNCCAGVWHA